VRSNQILSTLALTALGLAPGLAGCALDTTGSAIPGGGASSGGWTTGGDETGGDATGGDATGGDAGSTASQGGDAGSTASQGGDDAGGDATGGEGTGGDATGGWQTGGWQTGGWQTGGWQTGGWQTGGRATGGEDASGGTAGGEPCDPEAAHCAVTGQWCQDEVCACAPDQIVCGLECVYQWDDRNCGACGVICIQPEYCQKTEGGCAPPS